MNRCMFRSSKSNEVFGAIICRVAIDVMDHIPSWTRAIGRFVYQDGARLPDVRLGHLDPRPRRVGAVVALSDSHRADRQVVVRRNSGRELRGPAATFTPVDRVERVVRYGGTSERAVVRRVLPNFGWFAAEICATRRANKGNRHTSSLPLAGTGTTNAEVNP